MIRVSPFFCISPSLFSYAFLLFLSTLSFFSFFLFNPMFSCLHVPTWFYWYSKNNCFYSTFLSTNPPPPSFPLIKKNPSIVLAFNIKIYLCSNRYILKHIKIWCWNGSQQCGKPFQWVWNAWIKIGKVLRIKFLYYSSPRCWFDSQKRLLFQMWYELESR